MLCPKNCFKSISLILGYIIQATWQQSNRVLQTMETEQRSRVLLWKCIWWHSDRSIIWSLRNTPKKLDLFLWCRLLHLLEHHSNSKEIRRHVLLMGKED